jgi:Sortilin, neurotensin receptor 3,
MAVGNIGKQLERFKVDRMNTYLSRDGGLNWQEVKKGSHIYEVGDHGGLIVMAPDT